MLACSSPPRSPRSPASSPTSSATAPTSTGIVPGGHQLAHVRAAAERRRAAVDGRRRLPQRPPARGADQGARRGEPHRRTPRSSSSATQTIPEDEYIYDFSFPEEGGKPNPHLWTDPPLALRYAEIVRDDMSARDPDNADYYAANYDAFAALIDELDAAMRDGVRHGPATRKLLTYHDAYAYFAEDLRLGGHRRDPGVGLRGPDARGGRRPHRPGARPRSVPAIFGSEVFPSPVLEQIGREAGVEYVDVLRDDDLPGRAGRRRALVARADALRLHHDDRGARRRRRRRSRPFEVRNVAPDEAEYPQ